MNKQNVKDLYPLSPLQQGMLFHTLLAPGSGAYTEQITYELVGPLQVEVYHRCWQEALARHPVLRTAFFWENLPKPLQVVHKRLDLPMHVEDLRALGEEAARARVAEFQEADRQRGFDLNQAPLVRVAALRTGDEAWVCVFSFHHMLLDGWSLPIVFHEVFFAYEATIAGLRPAVAPPRPFRDYIGWLGKQSLAGAEEFWRRALAGFREPTPIGFAPPEHPAPGFSKSFGRLSVPVVAALQGLARRHKVTLNNVVQAAWALVLSRWSGNEDVVFGATVSGRPAELEGVEKMVGMFINTLPVRARVEPGLTVDELLDGLHAFMNEARLYEYAPLVEVQGWSEVPRDRPLFETLYVFENAPIRPRTDAMGVQVSSQEELEELQSRPEAGGTLRVLSAQSPERTNYPALLVVAPEGDEMALRLNVDTLRFDPAAGERMMRHLTAVLHTFAERPSTPLGDVQVMPADETERVRAWSAGESLGAPEELLHPLFEAQAARTPDAVALEHEGRGVTYAELEAGANRLAHHLVSLGVGPERRVGVCMRRTPAMVQALLAVLKAGGAYVPLDPAYPAERIAFMVDDTDSVVLLTEAAIAAGLPETRAAVVRVDADAQAIAARPSTPPVTGVTPRNLAYVIYTSGSTGRPKGVMIEHRSSAAITRWMRGEMTDDEISCVLGATSISFDVSIAEIFGTICWGGKLVLVENALSLAGLPKDAGIKTVVMVPSAANELLRMGAVPPSVTTFNLAGEALPAGLAQRLYATGTVATVRNLYGPTEDTTYSTWSVVGKGSPRVYIGRPLADSRAQVLNGRLEQVPQGVPGELFLAGAGLARGYLKRPGLTAERFLPDPHGPPGSRMYRVMDRARWSEGGELEYLERLDHQVKIRGYRIELGEIEAALASHASVLDCVVVARGQGDAPRELVAYVAGAPGAEVKAAELRAHLKGQLPAYMVPPFFVVLPEIPRSPNGKIDRAALPAPSAERAAPAARVAPRTATEKALAGIWGEVLGAEQVSANDDFFSLGGHSLLATRVVSRIRQVLEVEIPLRTLFEAPVLEELARRIDAERRGTAQEAMAPADRSRPLPLSFAQERLWFVDRLIPDSPAYNLPVVLPVGGADPDVLGRTLAEIVRRHESLRTTFAPHEGGAVQVVHPAGGFRMEVADLRPLGRDAARARSERLAAEETGRPFRLETGPLFRATLVRVADDEAVLVMVMHHIIGDAWSVDVLVRELQSLYEAFSRGLPSPLREPELQYADFAVWQRRRLSDDVLGEQVGYWKERLAGAPAVLELPTDRPRPAVESFRGALLPVAFPKSTADALNAVARREGATLFMVLLAAWNVLLSRYSGQRDIVVGSPIAGRNRAEVEGMIGFFVNNLVLRTDLSDDPGFRTLVRRVKDVTLGAYAHQDLPFERLVEELNVERSLAHSALFQVMFALQNTGTMGAGDGPASAESSAGDAKPVTVAGTSAPGSAKFDLTLSLAETPEGLAGTVEYSTDLFDEQTVRRMMHHFAALTAAAAADAETPVSRLPMFEAGERGRVLEEWNRTHREIPRDACIQHVFAAQVTSRPDAVAVSFQGRTLTYAQLNAKANRLAHHLIGLGVGPDVPVAISVERSAELVVAVYGVLKAGGAFLPLDPKHPAERRAYMLRDSGARVVITQPHLVDGLPEHDGTVVVIDGDGAPLAVEDAMRTDDPPIRTRPENLAYIIYTSGSTGRPKGVMAAHRGAVNLALGTAAPMGLHAESRVLQFASLTFDASVWEVLVTLVAGARLHLAPQEKLMPGAPLVATLRDEGITVVTLPPSVLAVLPEDAFPALETVISAGEACPADVARRWAPRHSFLNAYGPSEGTVSTSIAAGEDGSRTPAIGRPNANVRVYVLDRGLEPTPVGVPGEICIAGEGVTRGYLGRPGQTAGAFVPDPFGREPGARMYRTGDRGRWLEDGTLEYLGRMDAQVKVRGFRIELGEIEQALRSHEDVADAAVVAPSDHHGDRRLVAYVVPVEGGEIDADSVRAHVAAWLPEYMVPALIAVLPELPVTPNLKVDRRALENLDRGPTREHAAEPRTEAERAVAAIWCDLLAISRVAADDDFFALGGHSLLATRLVSAIREKLGVELPLRAVFEAPTVAGLAERVEAAKAAEAVPEAPRMVPVPRGGGIPLSFAQERLWFVDRLVPNNPAYNIAVALPVAGADPDVLERVLAEIVRRHESLRTTFAAQGGSAVQVVHPAGGFRLDVADLRSADGETAHAEAVRIYHEENNRPFDLATGPLFRARLARLPGDESLLVLVMHHIVSDAWSMDVLASELETLYAAFARGEASPLPEPALQYADFAVWQRGWLTDSVVEKQVGYWKERLAGSPAVLELPTDRPRPAVQSFRGATLPIAFPKSTADALNAVARREGATLFMVLLALWDVLLSRYSGQKDIVVGSPIAGRNRAEVEGMIGFFVNNLVLRTDVSDDPGFRTLVGRVKDVTLGAYAHQDLPFERLVEELNVERSLAHSALFQVMFVLQNTGTAAAADAAPSADGEAIEERPVTGPDPAIPGSAKFDLTLNLRETPQGLMGAVEFSTDLFDERTVRRMMHQLGALAAAAAADPETPVSRLPLFEAGERVRVLEEWNQTEREIPRDACIQHLFAAQVAARPNAVAVSFQGRTLTYAELNAKANRLAHHLIGLGVGPDVPVAISVDRSAELVVAVYGVLKAGGAFLPIDPRHPVERRAYMLHDSGARVIVTQPHLVETLPEHDGTVVVIDGDGAPIGVSNGGRTDDPPIRTAPENLAYVIYTSGSTGRPKGVMALHRGAVNLALGTAGPMGLSTESRVLQFASLTFDASAWELIVTLAAGARLHLAPQESLMPGAPLIATLRDEEITLVTLPPSVLAVLPEDGFPALETVISAGEACPAEVARRWAAHHVFLNAYGPTEGTVSTSIAAGEDGSRTPAIGGPNPNVRIYVLDGGVEPAPVGVPGEICIAGEGVTRGYLGRAAQTAGAFMPDPFGREPGARMYRTGDRGRWLEDGTLEYLGRVDEQVKVRGFRIEPGEVEQALRRHPRVADAVVIAREDVPGDRRLVAYVAPHAEGGQPTAAELRETAAAHVPDYMVPAHFVVLERLPLTPNLKVDRRALPAPRPEHGAEAAFAPAEGGTEEVLDAIWRAVLGVERVGANDNFFELGGHSLLLAKVQAAIQERLGREVQMIELFRFPTIRSLAAHLQGESADEGESAERGQAKAEARRAARSMRRARHGAR